MGDGTSWSIFAPFFLQPGGERGSEARCNFKIREYPFSPRSKIAFRVGGRGSQKCVIHSIFSPFLNLQSIGTTSALQGARNKGGCAAAPYGSQRLGTPRTTAAPPHPIPRPGPRPGAARPAPPRLLTSPAVNGPIRRRDETTRANQGLLTQASLRPPPRLQ